MAKKELPDWSHKIERKGRFLTLKSRLEIQQAYYANNYTFSELANIFKISETAVIKALSQQISINEFLDTKSVELSLNFINGFKSKEEYDKFKRDLAMLERLVDLRRQISQQKLESYLKGLDTDILLYIVRKFNPDVLEEEIIKLYKEALEFFRVQRSRKNISGKNLRPA